MARHHGAAPPGPGPSRSGAQAGGRAPDGPRRARHSFAALDLGSNNCRLLIAEPSETGFRVLDGYSEIVRLGEGVSSSHRLADAAMARAYKALSVCAARIAQHRPIAMGAIATQALRAADNGAQFLERVRADLGLEFRIIDPEEEAKLSVLGCAGLVDPDSEAALIVDIGGGSTELSWVETKALSESLAAGALDPPLLGWASTPIGVVALADAHPEPSPHGRWYEDMVADIAQRLGAAAPRLEGLREAFAEGRAHIVGTSGAVTSLAALHLGLRKYKRSEVDGLWITSAQCRAVIDNLRAMSPAERAANACIGRARADLVVPGAAILDAVCRLWPATRIRVADRGLREGVLMQLMAKPR